MRYLGKGSVSSFIGGAVNVAWYVILSAMGAILLAALAAAIAPQRLMNEFSTDHMSLDTAFFTLDFDQLTVRNPRTIALGFLGFALAMLGFATAIIGQLRGICANLRAEAPFAPENAGRIRTIGVLVIISTLVKSILFSLQGLLIMNNVTIAGAKIGVRVGSIDLTGILLGLLILVLAEIFRYGSELQEERNLTV